MCSWGQRHGTYFTHMRALLCGLRPDEVVLSSCVKLVLGPQVPLCVGLQPQDVPTLREFILVYIQVSCSDQQLIKTLPIPNWLSGPFDRKDNNLINLRFWCEAYEFVSIEETHPQVPLWVYVGSIRFPFKFLACIQENSSIGWRTRLFVKVPKEYLLHGAVTNISALIERHNPPQLYSNELTPQLLQQR